MGNDFSTENQTQKNNLEDLQKQLLENQLKIQNIQIQNLQKQNNYNNYNNNNNNNNNNFNNNQYQNNQSQQQNQSISLQKLLTDPQLQIEISKNPKLKEELLNKILTQYKDKLTYHQKEKIKSLLDITSYDQREINIQNNIEKQKMLEYTIEKNKQKTQFMEEQRRRRIEYQQKLQELNQENINAMKLFQLNEGYTYNDLKKSYKRLAIQTHPDRPKGSNDKFQVVTKCYFKLLEKLKTEETQPDFNQLKDNSRDYWSERSKMDQQFGSNN